MTPPTAAPFDPESLSAFLTFRYLPAKDAAWRPGLRPRALPDAARPTVAVAEARGVLEALETLVPQTPGTGLLLSGGIDSAILAQLLPAGRRAYTIRFVADGAVDEVPQAARYAEACGLEHVVVEVRWQDYLDEMAGLMRHKRAPLHAIEVPLYLAAKEARRRGDTQLVVGNGADSNFGGMDKLLARDWTYAGFVERYTFVDPTWALRDPRSQDEVFAPYGRGSDGFDVVGFLREVHGPGIIQAFENAADAAAVSLVEPYEALHLEGGLDLARVRGGEPKYVLREAFARLYPGWSIPDKIPFARPMDVWLRRPPPPTRPELLPGIDFAALSGDQRWLVHGLDRFLQEMDRP